MLKVEGLTKRFGPVLALTDVGLDVGEGEIFGIVGPNGSGKSTLVNCVSGALKPDAGSVALRGTEIIGWSTTRLVRAGLARTFQHPRSFIDITVGENVSVAVREQPRAGRNVTVREVARLVNLEHRLDHTPRMLSLSERRRLELARAIATNAAVLLLDEVMAGLSEAECHDMLTLIRSLSTRGVSVILVEHLVWVVSSLCDRVMALSNGLELCSGTPQHVFSDAGVVEAYLGQTIA